MLHCVIIDNVLAIIDNYTLYDCCTHTLATYLPIYFSYICNVCTYLIDIHDSKDHNYHLRGVIPGVAWGCHGIPRFKGQLTLSQPGEADYAYQITMAYLARVIWVL